MESQSADYEAITIVPAQPLYLMTSDQLLSPEVGAVEIGLLETGKFAEVYSKMQQEAASRGIESPRMIADIIFKKGAVTQFGSGGQPYPINQQEWEACADDVPVYCGERIPKIYMVDGRRFTAPI